MIAVLSKPADQIGVADIQELIDSQVPESQEIEFKETLPTEDGSLDRWITRGDRIGRRAKHKLLEESVAFANAYGGALVLGIAESESKPPAAASISPIPRCTDLAERLKQVLGHCVEPQIPSLEVFGVPTAGDSGVVIIRVGKSRMAPHRVAPTRECTIRRSDRCEKMTMREIQDLTLNLSRGMDRLERRLEERKDNFPKEFEHLDDPGDAFGIRVTAAPIMGDVKFDQVYGRADLCRPMFELSFFGDTRRVDAAPSSWWKPMLRAARLDLNESRYRYSYEEMHCDGLVESAEVSCATDLDPYDALTQVAAIAVWSDRVRSASANPTSEYAVDVEVQVRRQELPVVVRSNYRRIDGFMIGRVLGTIRSGSRSFPRYSLMDSGGIPELIAVFERDLWNLLGMNPNKSSSRLEKQDGISRLVFERSDQS